jgi:ABC-type uncharacterized transport system substrate-binding protein
VRVFRFAVGALTFLFRLTLSVGSAAEPTDTANLLCDYSTSLRNAQFERALNKLGEMPDADASEQRIAREIMDAVKLVANFIVREGDVSTAAASIKNKERFITYKRGLATDLTAETGSRWSPYCVFAHEIAHHILGHTIRETASRKTYELEADKWAGSVLAQLGVPLEESKAALRAVSTSTGDERHPGLQDRIRSLEQGWRGHETTIRDKRVRHIAIILNGHVYYAREIMVSLQAQLERKLSMTQYAVHFEFGVGVPGANDSKEQHAAFSELLGRFHRSEPDYLVTIGTQVTEYAYRHYRKRFPIVFAGVTDPICAKLVQTLEPDQSRGNIAGVAYGINPTNYIRFLGSAFVGKRFGFLYNTNYSQDECLKDQILRIAEAMNPPFPVQGFSVVSTKLSSEVLTNADIFFGRFYVMNNLVEFVANNEKPFVAADKSNLYKGALATLSSDAQEQGLIAADQILAPAILKGVSLSTLPIFNPVTQYIGINLESARRYGVTVSQEAIDNANTVVREK